MFAITSNMGPMFIIAFLCNFNIRQKSGQQFQEGRRENARIKLGPVLLVMAMASRALALHA
jgi:hypothetical protein